MSAQQSYKIRFHSSTVPDNVEKKLQCQVCFEQFPTIKALRSHVGAFQVGTLNLLAFLY